MSGGGIRPLLILLVVLLAIIASPSRAIAGCTGPTGNAGDINFLSGSGLMAYCNGTSWIAMGTSSTTTYGTLTTNNFCTASGSTSIQCTTTSTGSGNVVLSASPTVTGTLVGANSTWSGQVAIGTTTLSGALNVVGTINATTFAGSGASLTGIGTSALGGITGTPSSTTYLRGDGTWGTVTSMTYPGAGIPNSTGSAWGTSYSVTGTGNVVLSASPTLTGTITAAGANFSGNVGIGTATPTSTLTVNGSESLQFATDYSTATSTQNDVAINTASAIRYTGAGSVTFTGIAAGNAGQLLFLTNAATSTNTLTLNNQDAGSSAANRIITGTGAALSMANNSSVVLQYDGAASRWRVIGGSGSGGATPAGTTGQVQYNSGSSTLAASANMVWSNTNNALSIGTTAATPQTTTGTIASTYVNVTPQAGTYTSLSGASGVVTINAATVGQMAVYTGTNAVSGSPNLTVSGSNVALGTSTGSYLLSLDGQAARTIGMQRDYTAATVGQSLTVQAGGAVSGGTNLNGGNLVLASGVSTGTGTSSIQFQTYPGTAGSTTDNTIATAMTITGAGNVGIGTTSPTTQLDVHSGNINLTSASSAFSGSLNIYTNGNSGNTGVSLAQGFSSASDNIGYLLNRSNAAFVFGTNNTERLRIDSSGNVGIGTTSPRFPLHVMGTASTPGEVRVESPTTAPRFSWNFNTGGTDQKRWQFYATTNALNLTALNDAENSETNIMNVVRGTGTAISSINFLNGKVGVGRTSTGYPLDVYAASGGVGNFATGGSTSSDIALLANSGNCSTYLAWGNAGGYNWTNCPNSTLSDQRMKKEIQPVENALSMIMALKPVTYRWKQENKNTQLVNDPTKKAVHYGFIAQDFLKVIPDLVMEIPATAGDPTASKTETRYSLQYEGIISPLVKAVQELKADNDNLRAENANLRHDEDEKIHDLAAEVETLRAERGRK